MDKALSGEAVGPMKELTHRQRSRGLTSMDSAGATKGSAKYCVSRATLSPLNSMMRRRAKFHRHAVTVSTSRKLDLSRLRLPGELPNTVSQNI